MRVSPALFFISATKCSLQLLLFSQPLRLLFVCLHPGFGEACGCVRMCVLSLLEMLGHKIFV